jgi:HSP20 family protein
MAENTVPVPNGPRRREEREIARARERHMPPPMDIYESGDQLVLMADMPGVSSENLDVRVDDDILTIQGKALDPAPGDAIYREYELNSFFRQFQLSDEVDAEKVNAELRNGVLTVQLPKCEKAKPKQIQSRRTEAGFEARIA